MYLTVEEVDQSRIDQAFASLSARGLPAVRGEIVEGEEVAGYHYYPGRERAVEWFEREGLAIAGEGFRRENGWGYRHFLLRVPVRQRYRHHPRWWIIRHAHLTL
jgi:hypothetical protein